VAHRRELRAAKRARVRLSARSEDDDDDDDEDDDEEEEEEDVVTDGRVTAPRLLFRCGKVGVETVWAIGGGPAAKGPTQTRGPRFRRMATPRNRFDRGAALA
jgi:hypothetical protein